MMKFPHAQKESVGGGEQNSEDKIGDGDDKQNIAGVCGDEVVEEPSGGEERNGGDDERHEQLRAVGGFFLPHGLQSVAADADKIARAVGKHGEERSGVRGDFQGEHVAGRRRADLRVEQLQVSAGTDGQKLGHALHEREEDEDIKGHFARLGLKGVILQTKGRQ